MKTIQHIIFLFTCFFIWSCDIEPFDANSLTETGESGMPDTEMMEEDEESPVMEEEEEEEEMEEEPESEFTTGLIRYEIESRTITSVQNNATIEGNLTTIVGIDKLTGERILISFFGTRNGTYNLDAINEAIYYPDFNARPYSTAVHIGAGLLMITNFDTVNNQIFGTFQFTAYREVLDSLGNPVLDQDGNKTYEFVQLDNGEFEMVPLN